MLLSGHAHTVAPGEGRAVNLGVIHMRVLAAGKATTNGAFTLAEFTGGQGPWTVPHIHREMEESFYVLDGEFTFTVGEQEIPAGPGSYILVPRGTRHGITAGAEGGRFLTLMVPGGLEEMFFELAGLPPDSITDPAARSPPGTTPSPPYPPSTRTWPLSRCPPRSAAAPTPSSRWAASR